MKQHFLLQQFKRTLKLLGGVLLWGVLLVPQVGAAEPKGSESPAARAKAFLCARKYCVRDNYAIVRKSNLNFQGFFNRVRKEIWINANVDPINEQLYLVHEYVHAYRQQFNVKEAMWLEEGLAKFFEYQ
jgi:hypothetical protein